MTANKLILNIGAEVNFPTMFHLYYHLGVGFALASQRPARIHILLRCLGGQPNAVLRRITATVNLAEWDSHCPLGRKKGHVLSRENL